MGLSTCFSILTLCFLISCECVDLDYDGKLNIRLEHSFDHTPNPVYSHRGDLFIKSLHYGLATIEEFELTANQIKLLRDLASKDGNYKLRAIVKTIDGKENYYYTFVKACSLIASEMNNLISVNLDHSGNVIAVSMAVPSVCAAKDLSDSALSKLHTSIEIRHMELGPTPDTATYIQKLEREREAKERGETKDHRSFLAKYWMYIVPVVIFMLLPSATNPETGGGAAAQR